VPLDVVHVSQTPEGLGIKWLKGERTQIEVVDLEPC
jgi:hypothetical protein